jgi:hypothetical protein
MLHYYIGLPLFHLQEAVRLRHGYLIAARCRQQVVSYATSVRSFSNALLSKSSKGRADAICSLFYKAGTLIRLPSRVKRFSTAARTCSSAT